MPDVFGREAADYRHLEPLRRRGTLDQYLRADAEEWGCPRHDFRALASPGSRRVQQIPAMSARQTDMAQAFGFVSNNLLAIMAQIREVLYTELRFPEYMNIETGIAEGAVSWGDRITDMAGEGRWIDQDGTSAPRASASLTLQTYPLGYGGIVGDWNLESIRNAMFAGFPLSTKTMEAAVRGAMNHIERVGFTGDAQRGWEGLVNFTASGVTVNQQASMQTIAQLDAESLRSLLTDEITALINDTHEIVGRTLKTGLTIYVPIEQFTRIVTLPIGDNVDKSVWDYVLMRNAWNSWTGQQPMLKPLQELTGAGAGGTDRMIVTLNHPEVFVYPIPIMPRIVNTESSGYTVCSYMEYKMGPIALRRPHLVRYRDGI